MRLALWLLVALCWVCSPMPDAFGQKKTSKSAAPVAPAKQDKITAAPTQTKPILAKEPAAMPPVWQFISRPDSTWQGWPANLSRKVAVPVCLTTEIDDDALPTDYTVCGFLRADGWDGPIRVYRNDTLLALADMAGELIHGRCTLFFPDSLIAFHGRFLAGELDGLATWYHRSGKKAVETFYENDLPHGEHQSWYASGSSHESGTYDGGLKAGNWLYHAPNGRLCLEELYDSAGVLLSIPTLQSSTGKPLNPGNFKNGNGTLLRYTSDGQLKREEVYQAGRLTGAALTYDSTGQLAEKTNHLAGLKHGISELYWSAEKGKAPSPMVRYTWKEGQLHGPFIAWHKNGTVAQQGQYVLGKQDSTWYAWHENGAIAGRSQWLMGVPEGWQTQFYPNGQLRLQQKFVDGVLDSLAAAFYSNGEPLYQREYDMGQPVGTWSTYYTDGKDESLQDYIEGRKDGRQQAWYVNGQQSLDVAWVQGKKQGPFKTWYQNGKQECKGNYVNDEPDGEWQYWHGNGKPKTIEMFKAGLLMEARPIFNPDGKVISMLTVENGNGRRQSFHPGGQVASDGFYRNGKRHGQWEFFNQAGQLEALGTYQDGERTGTWKVLLNGKLYPKRFGKRQAIAGK